MMQSLLAQRFARCGRPLRIRGESGNVLLPSEESASIWLWAWPSLLGWRRRINWLFSPVTGNTRHPGDLWDLDAAGNLLIVETKLDKAGSPQNPLEDFLAYVQDPDAQARWTSEALYTRWARLFQSELKF